MIRCGNTQVAQVQVKWSELPDELATWEDYTTLKQTFPQAPAWGQAGFQEPGSVSTASGDNGSVAMEQQQDTQIPRRSVRPRKGNVRITCPEWY
jgi:hypothetical protein